MSQVCMAGAISSSPAISSPAISSSPPVSVEKVVKAKKIPSNAIKTSVYNSQTSELHEFDMIKLAANFLGIVEDEKIKNFNTSLRMRPKGFVPKKHEGFLVFKTSVVEVNKEEELKNKIMYLEDQLEKLKVKQ
jgi:hypothetical protein